MWFIESETIKHYIVERLNSTCLVEMLFKKSFTFKKNCLKQTITNQYEHLKQNRTLVLDGTH